MKIPALAGTLPFAHLLGRPAAARAEKDEDKPDRDAEDDNLDNEDNDGDDEKKDDAKKARGSRANGGSDEDDSEEKKRDDEEKDDAKKARGKGARADDDGDDGASDDDDEEGDDDSDGADMTKKGSRAARLRERARCEAIFSDAAAGTNPALAASLAFHSDMPRSKAIKTLRTGVASGSSRRTSLDERMAGVKTPNTGSGAPARGAVSTADQIIAAGKRRRGEA